MTRFVAAFDVGWLWSLAGWTMLHYLWTGLVFLLFAAAGRLLLRHTVPQIRYVYAIGWLVLLAILPIGIAGWVAAALNQAPPAAIATITSAPTTEASGAGPMVELHVEPRDVGRAAGTLAPIDALPDAVEPPDVAALDVAALDPPMQRRPPRQVSPLTMRVENFCYAVAGYLPWLWLAGAPFTFALLATGLVGVERLSRQSRPLADGPIVALCADLARSFGIGRHVAVGVCERIHSPILVGVIRPLILLPPAALTGWSPQQLEMVLLHELAHVRRWDNLVNLVQRLIESVLFFQPAVWIVSHWVRAEREHCCDAAVVRRTQRPTEYAKTLAALATAHVSTAEVTRMAAGPVSAMAQQQLVRRIRHILDQEREPMQVSRKTLAGVLFVVLLTIVTAIFLPSSAVQADPETDDRAAETTVVEEEGEASDADKAVLALKKPPKPEPQPETSTDKATTADLDLREAQLEYDWAKQRADLISQRFRSGQATQLSALEAKRKLEMAEIQLERAKRRIADSGNVVRVVVSAYPEPRRIVDNAEKQRTADMAWRMLGLELEEVSRDQIAHLFQNHAGSSSRQEDGVEGKDSGTRLKKASNQYHGGLRCIHSDELRAPTIREGDVLLGLHIWETATLQDLGYILSLPNIADLSPMKCYLLRDGKVDHLRLQVTGFVIGGSRRGGRSEMGGGRVATRATQRALGGSRKGPQPSVKQSEEGAMSLSRHNKSPSPHPSHASGGGGFGIGAQQPAAVDKSSLLYDGKSFGLWQKVWRRELNPERRTDAIRAFAAFAKNGYGREAAEAIVEIMRNYDSYAIDGSPTGKLKGVAIEVLASIDPKVRDPVLVAALKSSDRNAVIFATHVITIFRFDVETFVPILRQLVENKENDRRVRAMAINALSTNQASEETQQLLFDAINDDDPMIAQSAIRGIPVAGPFIRDYNPYIARLIDAMGRSDGSVRQAAYRALGRLGPASKPAVPALVKTLLENKDTGEFPMIIAALTRIGTAAEEAVPALVELWKSNSGNLPEQEAIRRLILKALQKIAPEEVAKLPRE